MTTRMFPSRHIVIRTLEYLARKYLFDHKIEKKKSINKEKKNGSVLKSIFIWPLPFTTAA